MDYFAGIAIDELNQAHLDLFGKPALMTTCGHCNAIVLQEFAKVLTVILTEHVSHQEHFCGESCAHAWWRTRSGDA